MVRCQQARWWDPASSSNEAVELIYKEKIGSWDVISVATRERLGTFPFEGGVVNGMEFSVAGEPENGDVILLRLSFALLNPSRF